MLANPLRTMLTMLGIIIGIASVVLMLAVGDGIKLFIDKQLSVLGSNLVIVQADSRKAVGARLRTGTVQTITLDDAEAINRLPSVKGAAPMLTTYSQISYGNDNTNTQVQGTTPISFAIRNLRLAKGIGLSEVDIASASRVAVLGKKVAEQLFYKNDPIGQTIRIDNQSFQVIGVLDNEGQSFDSGDIGEVVMVPISTARVTLIRTATPRTVQYVVVQSKTTEGLNDMVADIYDLMRDRHRIRAEEPDDFRVVNFGEFAKTGEAIATGLSIALGFVGAVSLVVGGIGIMNIMLVSVTERTREIGIRMAIGARPSDVLWQFLIEAVAICLVSGIIGVALSAGVASAVSSTGKFEMAIGAKAVGIAVVFSCIVGIFFGFYPARRASKLQPVECLRYE
ncbi:MAG: FtsX-like permease family protein [Betaproteobacteria bacterium]|nr:MAG: FtsX-like permease family protein [Betaproteobacteria bacterium]